MAKAADDAGLWPQPPVLPAADLDAVFGFPSEFPYEFGSPSPVGSVAGSTETESSDEEEDFFAGLTRRLSQATLNEPRKPQRTPPITAASKPEGMAGSPQSTLSGIGSWSGRSGEGTPSAASRVPSPSTTPFPDQNDPWEVIYAAAGQVARLKVNGRGNAGLLAQPRAAPKSPNASAFPNHAPQVPKPAGRQQAHWVVLQQQSRAREAGYEGPKCGDRLPSAWPPLQRLHFGGSGPKRGSAGTGVFLPRHYGNPSPEPRKRNGPAVLPARVVHALNLNIEDLNAAFVQPRFSNALAAEYDALLARRNALLMQQQRLNAARREEAASREIRLPQEWTY